ncbi:hypothetical protein CPLU01_08349 [Colletotrichum plurivorum]|uniref:Uncharacterized protein n=1 Tax=Colletotrichum plurivorum TaxID=2175906 RepID=A0A8H6KBN7_9PEZI|nr:hypothetical protein CPLU01_08349 [Colletotrichum plurivorum]
MVLTNERRRKGDAGGLIRPAARIRIRFAHLTPAYANSQLFGSTPRLAFLSARLSRRNVFLFFPTTAA